MFIYLNETSNKDIVFPAFTGSSAHTNKNYGTRTDVCDAEADADVVKEGFKLSTGATCQNRK